MPYFVWVVRDFSYDLVDSQDKDITPDAYLNSALNEQNGYSDTIEEKNRIRRLVRAFFPDRKCCIMVRPAIDEKILRSLDQAPID